MQLIIEQITLDMRKGYKAQSCLPQEHIAVSLIATRRNSKRTIGLRRFCV